MDDLKQKIKDYISNTGKKKIIITSIILLFLLYKLFISQGIGLFDRREKIEDNNIKYEESMDKNEKSLLEKKSNAKESEPKEISVYISGEISSPGVVKLPNGSRLDDAIKKLGGLSKDADTNRINLALKLEDSSHYIIPKKGENLQVDNGQTQSSLNTSQTSSSNNGNNSNKIDINSADEKKLQEIPGVGPSTSKKIIDYRNKEGKFKDIEDLKNISGIGEKKFENMKDSIVAN